MTLPPLYLLDTCTIINLTYSQPISALFQKLMVPSLGWVEVVKTELRTKTTSRPPLPNAVQALRWGLTNLGTPIPMTEDSADLRSIAEIQASIGLAPGGSPFQHLGEATSIYYLNLRGGGFLVSDDHDARSEAQVRGVRALSSVGLISRFMRNPLKLSDDEVDKYLDRLRSAGRMHVPLTASTLRAGDLMGWG